jgi:hypothetical protein
MNWRGRKQHGRDVCREAALIQGEIRTITAISITISWQPGRMILVGVVGWSEKAADAIRSGPTTGTQYWPKESRGNGEVAVTAHHHHLIGEMEITPITITILVGGLEETIEGVGWTGGAVVVVIHYHQRHQSNLAWLLVTVVPNKSKSDNTAKSKKADNRNKSPTTRTTTTTTTRRGTTITEQRQREQQQQ